MTSNQEFFSGRPEPIFRAVHHALRANDGMDITRDKGCRTTADACAKLDAPTLITFLRAAAIHISNVEKQTGGQATPRVRSKPFENEVNKILADDGWTGALSKDNLRPPIDQNSVVPAKREHSIPDSSVANRDLSAKPTRTSTHAVASPKETIMTMTGTRSILFMDVSGWSKLTMVDIKRYVESALPKLNPLLADADFLNTWGDAIVATFNSANQAAQAALKIRDFFTQSTVEQGVPEGLVCRISLHQGEILLCENALTGTRDIFGHAVHVAARLEPATAPRQIFCTDSFARALQDIGGLGPKAWYLGSLVLPKKFGEIVASVVTWPNEADPTPGLQEYIRRVEESNPSGSP
ncbi:adenylate/guanylate cyclase domain-containing protein [Sorangium sp. So ce1151]|uniref:adenylate/guanylate cyclase domain-containing protein n=1 Tax=Sorangium sp. So ce1151 TaxID=3133332 RepID=UPI003F6472F9